MSKQIMELQSSMYHNHVYGNDPEEQPIIMHHWMSNNCIHSYTDITVEAMTKTNQRIMQDKLMIK